MMSGNKQSTTEVFARIVEKTDRFIEDPKRHNLNGIKKLIEQRRMLLSRLEIAPPAGTTTQSEADRIDSLLNRILGQDESLEAIVRRLQKDISQSIDNMRRVKKEFSGYKSKKLRGARFIDKKR